MKKYIIKGQGGLSSLGKAIKIIGTKTKYVAPTVKSVVSKSPKLTESFKINSNIDVLKDNIFKEAVLRAGNPVIGSIGKSPTPVSIAMSRMNGTYDPTVFGGLKLNPNYYYRRGWGIVEDAIDTGIIRVPESGYIKEALKKYPWLDNGNPFSTTLRGQDFPYFSEGRFWPSGGKYGVEPTDLIAIPKGLPWVNWVAGSKWGSLMPYSKPSEFGGRATPLINGQTNLFPTKHSLLFRLNPETKEYNPISGIHFGYASPTATKGNLKQLDNFIENDIFPRLQAAGHNVDYSKTTMPTLRQFDPKNNQMDKLLLENDPIAKTSSGMFHSPTNTAMTIDKPSETDYGLLVHELAGHGVRYNINPDYKPVTQSVFEKVINDVPLSKEEDEMLLNWNSADQLYTPVETSLLNTSYGPFFKGGKAEGKLHDYGAVNTQLRSEISQRNGYAVGDKLDPFIDNISDVDLLKMLLNQPYTRNGTTQVLKDVSGFKFINNPNDIELTNLVNKYPELSKMLKRIKDTMKYVGAAAPIGIGAATISKEKKGGKI